MMVMIPLLVIVILLEATDHIFILEEEVPATHLLHLTEEEDWEEGQEDQEDQEEGDPLMETHHHKEGSLYLSMPLLLHVG